MKKLLVVGPDNKTGFRKHLEELTFCYNGPSKFFKITSSGDRQLPDIISEKPDLTIIGGRNWIKRNSHVLDEISGKKALLLAGPLGQNEISEIEIRNLVHFLCLLDEGRYDYLLTGCPRLAARLARPDVLYMPAPFSGTYDYSPQKRNLDGKISILNDNAPHKNTLNSIGGIALSQLTKTFTVNGLPDEHLELVCRFGLSSKMRNVGMLEECAYYQEIRNSKLMLHLSYSEGLCYGVMEAFYNFTPVLVTNAMPWFCHPGVCVNDPADHQEIADTIDRILRMDWSSYDLLCKVGRDLAERKAKENNSIVRKVLISML